MIVIIKKCCNPFLMTELCVSHHSVTATKKKLAAKLQNYKLNNQRQNNHKKLGYSSHGARTRPNEKS